MPLLAAAVGEPVGLVKGVNDEVVAVDVAVDAELEEDGFSELSSMIKTH